MNTDMTPRDELQRPSRPPRATLREPNTSKTQILIWGVPRDLKHRFKINCARRGLTMREVILKFLRENSGV
jgi:hypothetical protein